MSPRPRRSSRGRGAASASPHGPARRACRRCGSGRGGTAPGAHAGWPASHSAYSKVQWPQSPSAGTRRPCTARRGSAGRRRRTSSSTPVGDGVAAVDGLLVVGQVGDGHAAQRRRGSRTCARRGGSAADLTFAVADARTRSSADVVEADVAGRSLRASPGSSGGRMSRRTPRRRERPSSCGGRVDVELGAGPQQRGEERQALDVVPVEVGEQAVPRNEPSRG